MPAVDVNSSVLALSLRRGLVFLAAALIGGSSILVLELLQHRDAPAWVYWGYTAACWLYVGAGCLAWWRRPSNGTGALLVWGGIALELLVVGSGSAPVLRSVGLITATVPLAVLVHLLHAFPSGRIRTRASRVIVVAGYVVCLVLQIPLYAFDPQPRGLPVFLAARPDLVSLGRAVQAVVGAGVMVATVAVLLNRLRRAQPWQRRTLVPLFGYGILTALFIPLSSEMLTTWLGWTPFELGLSQLIAVAGVPVAFATGVLRGGFARTGEIQELASWLSAPTESRPELAPALATVLGDPSLQVVFRVPERDAWVNSAGESVDLPRRPGRSAVTIDLAGEPIGALLYDSDLIADAELVRTAGRMVALGIERERLTAALRAGEQSLRRSRERLVEAADRERRRIAQDLHDGIQVTLVLLAIEAQQLANRLGTASPDRDDAVALRRGIDRAAAELRSLVHAVMPSALLERGLGLATEDLVDRLPVPARLQLGTLTTLPAPVANTAYFIVAEALANVVKHAAATVVSVRLEMVDGTLEIDVVDDGRGGAARSAGSGLRGLADRVDVLGGSFTLTSPAGVGTTVAVRLPVSQHADRRVPVVRHIPDPPADNDPPATTPVPVALTHEPSE